MHRVHLLFAASLIAIACAGDAAAAEPVPCENMLKDVKAAVASASLSDADKAKVADLQSQGIERCKADDDAGADELFGQAMKVMGK
jgi:hypothetical protein